jgi:hypothetical protein
MIQLVGMRYGQSGVGDLAFTCQPLEVECVSLLECSEYETASAERWRGRHDGHYGA